MALMLVGHHQDDQQDDMENQKWSLTLICQLDHMEHQDSQVHMDHPVHMDHQVHLDHQIKQKDHEVDPSW